MGTVADLKAIAVDGRNGACLAHENVRVIDVAAKEARLVNGSKKACDIGGDVDKKAKVRGREVLNARARTVELEKRTGVEDTRHDKARDVAIGRSEQIHRPSRDR